MPTATVTFEDVFRMAQQLKPADRVRLVARLAQTVEPFLETVDRPTPRSPRRRLRGLLADLGPAPSADDIDEVQRDMWAPLAERDA